MVIDDLSEARAKIEWADSHLDVLTGKISAFFRREPYRLRPEANPNGNGEYLFFEVTEAIPQSIQVDVGQIIYAQRSSLDILACVLAEREGHIDPRRTYFPITETEDRLSEKQARDKIRYLSDADKAAIHALKPYKGGNNLLFALHQLNMQDKHRKLILLGASVAGAEYSVKPGHGGGHVRAFALYGKTFQDGECVALWDADPQMGLNLALQIALADVPEIGRPPVIGMLQKFSRVANAVIDTFAYPIERRKAQPRPKEVIERERREAALLHPGNCSKPAPKRFTAEGVNPSTGVHISVTSDTQAFADDHLAALMGPIS